MLPLIAKLFRTAVTFLRYCVLNPRGLPLLCRSVLNHDLQATAPNMRHCTLEDVLTEGCNAQGRVDASVAIPVLPGDRTISLSEALALCALVAATGARRCFEIGTYRGWTAYALAGAMGEGGEVFTLDLPRGTRPRLPVKNRDVYDFSERCVGNTVEAPPRQGGRVVQLEGDSATFDFSPWAHSIDMVFVDGAHTEEYVRNDTCQAFRIVRSGGLVAWHDLKESCPGVVRVLSELGREVPLYHIRETSLVVATG